MPRGLLTARGWRWLAGCFALGLVIFALATSRAERPEPATLSPWSLIP